MLENIASRLTDQLYLHCPLDQRKKVIYTYGIQLSLSTLASMCSIVLLGILLGDAPSAFLFLGVFFFLRLFGGGYHAPTYHGELFSPTLSLLEEIAARQERGNAKLYELNTALADLNEKAHTLQRLHNKGFIEDADFREQSDALASQRKKLSDQRAQAIHGSKALETLDKLRELQDTLAALPEIPWEFDMDLFDQLVEKIVPISNTELLFKLKCGLELKEVIPQ